MPKPDGFSNLRALIAATKAASEKAIPGPPWRYVPWHIEEGPPAVRAREGWLICTTSSDETAAFIAHASTAAPALADIAEKMLAVCEADEALCVAINSFRSPDWIVQLCLRDNDKAAEWQKAWEAIRTAGQARDAALTAALEN